MKTALTAFFTFVFQEIMKHVNKAANKKKLEKDIEDSNKKIESAATDLSRPENIKSIRDELNR